MEIGRGSSDATYPLVALETWPKFAKIVHGLLFRRVTGQGKVVRPDRLTDKQIARLVKRTAMAAGIRGDLSEAERQEKFAGHSLRAGLASSAEVDERHVQKQLGHASAEMTRRYQRRRDRFRFNLTKAVALELSTIAARPHFLYIVMMVIMVMEVGMLPAPEENANWTVARAKARLSEVIERAQASPQTITRNGKPSVVVVSAAEWQRKTERKGTLAQFLLESPLRGLDLDLERVRTEPRDVLL